jgi:hypothetical protein
LYFVFFWVTYNHHHWGVSYSSSSSSSSLFATAGVVASTRMAHQRESTIGTMVTDEVGTVIKTGIARATQAELMFIALRSTLISSKLESSDVLLADNRSSSGSSSGSPVVSSSNRSHRSSFVSLSVR